MTFRERRPSSTTFLAATMDPPRLRVPLSEEDEARAARELEGVYEDEDDLWA